MRKESWSVDSYVHVIKRGVRGLPIVRDEADRKRFLLMLAHFNDEYSSPNWSRDIHDAGLAAAFERPEHWPDKKPLAEITAFCLVENHFHLILKEVQKSGIARFMQRLGNGMAKAFNERHKESGSLFEGPYRARTLDDDRYFRYAATYVQVKNAFDLYPGGQERAAREFDTAFAWAISNPYTSLGDYYGLSRRPFVSTEFLASLFTPTEYKSFSKDVVLGRIKSDIPEIALE